MTRQELRQRLWAHDTFVDFWTIDAEGGVPRRLTSDSGHQNRPTWSGDGTYVYYSEITGNQQDIWRIPPAGGEAQQVTRTGSGLQAYEVTSGRFLVYQSGDGKKPLLLLPLGGGIAKQVVGCVRRAGFAARQDAVYYVGCEASASPSIHRVDPLTGRDARLRTPQPFGTAASLVRSFRSGSWPNC